MSLPESRIFLVNVGVNAGHGGARSPLFADGTFEWVPIPEPAEWAGPHSVRYADLPQWQQLKAILVEVFRLHPSAGETFLTKTGHLRLIEERPEWTTPSVN